MSRTSDSFQELLDDFALIRDALEWANRYRADGNDRRFQEALAVLARLEERENDHYQDALEHRWRE